MDKQIRNSTAEFLIFTSQNKEDSIEVKVFQESVWLTQNMIAQLFEKSVSTINEHIKNIYKEKELSEIDTIKKFGNSEFAKKPTNYYNLDLIISVGYRVNSKKATQFRQWATSVLKEFAIKGFVLDKKRLENGVFLGQNYFDKLLEEIREIRLSERMFYQKLTDIYSTSVDYNKDDETTKNFFAKVQNKLHFAITKLTAAEIISQRANASLPNMGITTLSTDSIKSTDVTVAKKGGLLHDIGKAVDYEVQGTHPEIGKNIAQKFNLPENIIIPIATHHDDMPPTLEAVIVKVADQISGARPGSRKDTIENYMQRLGDLEEVAIRNEKVQKAYAISAGRELRIFVDSEASDDLEALNLAKKIALDIENELKYPGEIKITMIREKRIIEYAR